jgi:pyridoxamine 5'-phosphate oxidase
MNVDIASIRRDYQLKSFEQTDANKNPFQQFKAWFNEAVESEIDEVNAFTLATCSNEGKPSARIVLLKDATDFGFTFFTNYNSKKGIEILNNPNAAICFFWKELERQIRIEGTIVKASVQESEAYFKSRPIGSQLGAWASPQSSTILDRSILENNLKHYASMYQNDVPKPEHWGGYTLIPNYFEFWQGRSSRLHDRIAYEFKNDEWLISRLAP